MANFTQRDAGKLEADRQKQFSHLRQVRLSLYDREGEKLREIKSWWNRYRKTTREGAIYFQIKVADLRDEYAADMRKVGDGGTLRIESLSEEARYSVNGVEGWQMGEPHVWTVKAIAQVAPALQFYRAP